ncbi:hypothetical protein PAT3040_03729 [Paenibacillus agaridevorans]|uniref:Uncharacterized protein n=1 Tax=Paenibacillus agaridevorans TaxID=171404 RepID=A0A2R5EQZ2_9BACL|nr:hypothetical protein PAT3040_03729 [Paenibacillus agaridevorans]
MRNDDIFNEIQFSSHINTAVKKLYIKLGVDVCEREFQKAGTVHASFDRRIQHAFDCLYKQQQQSG